MSDDLGKILSNQDRRLYRLEQQQSAPSVSTSDGVFDSIVIGGNTITADAPSAPDGLVATPGTFYDNIFADLSWDESTSDDASGYTIEVAIASDVGGGSFTYDLWRAAESFSNSYRVDDLRPNEDYAFRVRTFNRLGFKGSYSTWVHFSTGSDSDAPGYVTNLQANRGATSIVAKWTAPSDPDIAGYQVRVTDTLDFTNGSYTRLVNTTATIVAFTDVVDLGDSDGTYQVEVTAYDHSGNYSAQVQVPVTAGGVIDSMIVAGLDAAKITYGVMSGDRLQANTADIGILKTSTLTSRTITLGSGGTIKIGSPPADGIYINDQGIRAYKASSETFSLDADGTATFSGTVTASVVNGSTINGGVIEGGTYQTAASGARMTFRPPTNWTSQDPSDPPVAFYSGFSDEDSPGSVVSYGTDYGSSQFSHAVALAGVKYTSLGGGWSLNRPWIRLFSKNWGSAPMSTIDLNGADRINLNSETKILGTLDVTGTVTFDGDLTLDGSNALLSVDQIYSSHYVYGDLCQLNETVGGVPYVRLQPIRARTTASAANVHVEDPSGLMKMVTSSRRYKREIEELDVADLTERFRRVRPVTFKSSVDFIDGDKLSEKLHIGMIAEEVHDALGDLAALFVVYDEQGRPNALSYDRFGVLALEQIRILNDRIEELERGRQ